MPKSKLFIISLIMIGCLSLYLGIDTRTANAQCGSQASSCKNCHEVQGELPVNNDGSSWHQAHSFGDFCYICHAGNSQSTDKDTAHIGMVAPLLDLKASCQQCHLDDLMDRAQVYADQLGVQISMNTNISADSVGEPTLTDAGRASVSGIGLMSPTDLVIQDPNLIDYVQNYQETVLGKHQTNWGNVILSVMIGSLVLGGGAFILHNEGWVGVSFESVTEYPADLVSFLPELSRLSPDHRKKLKKLLEDPQMLSTALNRANHPEDFER